MNIALILSGGNGTRLGMDIPKQYVEVGGQPIIAYCIAQFVRHSQIDAIQIVADSQWQRQILEWISVNDYMVKFRGFSNPGENRQMSIFHGLEDIKKYADDMDYVMIHDAARPCLSKKQITDCLAAAEGHDGVIPVLPMKDTVYSSADGRRVSSLLKRSEIFAGQAPEIFLLGKYLEANRSLLPDQILNINGSTEPAVMAGMNIAMIPGDENNFKITTKADLEHFCRLEEKGTGR